VTGLFRAVRPAVAYRYNLVGVRVLLVSADPKVREMMSLVIRSVGRSLGPNQSLDFIEARDGVSGIARAWKENPDVVVADEITSRAGAFALAKDLTGAEPPHHARIVVLLERPQDAWLASWSGADAWFAKPVNPFELADVVAGFMAGPEKEAV
jgi:CheY-like chemotaxis protein